MLMLIIIVAIIVVVAGVSARLALPSLREYRAVQNDKRTAQLERELHMGDYAALDRTAPPDPRPTWVKNVNRASTYLSTAGASVASTPPKPKPKVLHIEDAPDVPAPAEETDWYKKRFGDKW